jgi:hypothetical protein
MNVRRLRILISLLILLIGLTACEGEGEALVPLDPSSWPTPLPSVERPTVTPFPRVADAESTEAQAVVQVEATATPEPTATLTTTMVETTTTTVEAEPTAMAEASEASEANEAVTPTAMGAEATSTTSPTESTTVNATDATASVGYVSSYGLNMRQGAGPGFEVVVQLGQGDEVTLLDRDEASGWINIQTADGLIGWVNPEVVVFAGEVEPVSALTDTDYLHIVDRKRHRWRALSVVHTLPGFCRIRTNTEPQRAKWLSGSATRRACSLRFSSNRNPSRSILSIQ